MLRLSKGFTPRIIWSFVLFGLSLALIFGGIGFAFGWNNLQRTAETNINILASEKTVEILAWQSDLFEAVQGIGARPRLNASILDQVFDDRLTDAERTLLSDDRTQYIEESLGTWLGTGPGFVAFDVVDVESGLVRRSTEPDHVGLDRATAPYFTGAQEGPVMQQGYATLGAERVMVAAVPIRTPADRTVGLLVASFETGDYEAMIARLGDGPVLYHAYSLDGKGHLTAISAHLGERAMIGDPVDSSVASACMAGQSGTLGGENLAGQAVLSAFRWIDPLGQCLVVEIERTDVFSPVGALVRFIVLAGLFFLPLSAGLGILLARTVARPLRELEAGVEALTAGDLAYRVQEEHGGEVGRLAVALNTMAQARMEAEGLTDAVFDVTDSLLIVLDHTGCVLRFNQACVQSTGYAANEVIGTKIWQLLIPDEERSGVEAVFEQLAAGMFPMAYRNHWQAKDGSLRLIDWSNNCMLDKNGEVTHVIGTGIDITDRRKAESERNNLAAILESTTDMVAIADLDGQTVYMNHAGTKMLGYTEAEVVGLPIAAAHPEDTVDVVLHQAIPHAMEHTTWTGETKFRTKTGKIVPVSQTIIAHRNEQGELTMLSTIARDISSRIALESELRAIHEDLEQRVRDRTAALRQSEERYRQLAEASPDLIFIIDDQDRVAYVNSRAAVIFGLSPEELMGTPRANLFRGEAGAHQREALDRVFATGSPIHAEAPAKFPDKELWLSTWLIPIGNDREGVRNVLGISRDITQSKKAEIALVQSEERLRQVNSELERSNTELERFAYVASHDLQEPLRKITAFGDRLVRRYGSVLEGSGLDYLERMQDASERMQILIDDLLSYSRITTQAKPFVKTDLKAVLTSTLRDLELRIRETNAQINVDELPVIMADRQQMQQLFQNLVGNALKFHHPDQSPVVHISADPPTDGLIRIRVADNGIGLDPKFADQIFAPFQRLHSRVEYAGSGIGLAICRKIVERHGGTITVESQPGQGATFICTLSEANRTAPEASPEE